MLVAFPFFLNMIVYFGNTMGESFMYIRGNHRAQVWSTSNLNHLFTDTGTNLSLFYPGTWLATFLILGLFFVYCWGFI